MTNYTAQFFLKIAKLFQSTANGHRGLIGRIAAEHAVIRIRLENERATLHRRPSTDSIAKDTNSKNECAKTNRIASVSVFKVCQ